jgi:hypothetical protein
VANAGVVLTTHSAANSTKHRLRAIRHSGSPTSMERNNQVKYDATLSVLLGVAHSLCIMPVDNLCIFTPSSTFESDSGDAVNALHCKTAFAAIGSSYITICIDVTIDPIGCVAH